MRRMFRTVVECAFDGHSNKDKACLVIYHEDLEEDVVVSLRDVGAFTEDTVLDYIEDEHLNISKPFKLKFTILCGQ